MLSILLVDVKLIRQTPSHLAVQQHSKWNGASKVYQVSQYSNFDLKKELFGLQTFAEDQ